MSLTKILLGYSPPLYSIYTAFRAAQVDRRISAEQQFYERTAGRNSVSPVFCRLAQRLTQRGLGPVIKQLGNVHILYASRPSNWELHNIPPEIEKLCHLTTYYYTQRGFDDTSSDWLQTRARMDDDLLAFVTETHTRHPIDLFLGYLSGWQVSPDTIRRIGELGIVTCGFHLDDKPSFRGQFSGGRWTGPAALVSAYDINLTNAPSSIVKYEAEGGIALFWPEGANPGHYKPLDLLFEYDVSFIGACYGYRPILIDYLRKNGIKVETFGPGWPNGPVSEVRMVEIYAKSRVNLGFGGIGFSSKCQCLKGRDFEVPMSGAVYLTSYNDELELVYDVSSEIVTYRDKFDCLSQIKRLLMDPEYADNIRKQARTRCLRDHTWSCRVKYLLRSVGMIGEKNQWRN